MTALGKLTATDIRLGMARGGSFSVLVVDIPADRPAELRTKDGPDATLEPAKKKTGARVAKVESVRCVGGFKQVRYQLKTDLGIVAAAIGSQTFWDATKDAA